ncbi:hypothetical protein INT48_000620 [Thamnidium elegans]|uniref:Uncharacterized protein n=1 Tax=Thamnidium elegans TaxID=101142 RepID=A0A8H7VWF9_9FUNG|nr:hypothetical protein INT48_000620 [Thamnidium elegans]
MRKRGLFNYGKKDLFNHHNIFTFSHTHTCAKKVRAGSVNGDVPRINHKKNAHLTTALPSRPGWDLFCKEMLCVGEVKDIVAQTARFYTFDSIATHLNDDRLDEMIALCHVFITQEKNIMLLHRHGDKIIQTIYKVALDSCPVETDHVTQLTSDVKSFCDIIGRQFKKVVKEGDRKRQLKYAEDGANFTRQFKRKFVQLSDGIVVTPIESIANQESESVDLVFVKKIKGKQH